mmetsp:Transcript_77351/g.125236  ORF Transcript_77351/g.125236 Transcript_77351/m.125236 type:complete len:439 (+) Transcript_77351:157-1473(+)
MVPPNALGNPDPEVEWRPARGDFGQEPEIVLVEAEAYPNAAPRKCVWTMLMLSTLMILHVQKDRYVEALRWRTGIPDEGPPLPWESQALVSGNDTFQATFLAPSMRRASSFVQLPSNSPLVITGLLQRVFAGDSSNPGSVMAPAPPAGVTAVVVGTEQFALTQACPGSAWAACHAGVQRAEESSVPVRQLPGASTCHRFLTGTSLSSLAAPLGSFRGLLCTRSTSIHSAVATSATSSENSTVVLAWEARSGSAQDSGRPVSCLASVSFPSMRLIRSVPVDFAASVHFDRATQSLITVGFSSAQTILVDQFDAKTLKPQLRYALPLSVAWLLHAPRVSDGFLLFLGSEVPFVGTIFAINLKKSLLYQQDPPVGSRKPRRWVLPADKFVERLPDNSVLSSGTGKNAFLGQKGITGDGPCAAVSQEDLGDGRSRSLETGQS